MKTLYIIRHAKSSWDYDVDDNNRPLSQRGIKDAHLVSKHIKDKITLPDAVFSSFANRALHTCMIFLRTLQIPFTKLEITEEMYDFGGEKVMTLLKSIENKYETVMIFGHNHALTTITNLLGDKHINNLPTSGFVQINFGVANWSEIQKGSTKRTIFPKELK